MNCKRYPTILRITEVLHEIWCKNLLRMRQLNSELKDHWRTSSKDPRSINARNVNFKWVVNDILRMTEVLHEVWYSNLLMCGFVCPNMTGGAFEHHTSENISKASQDNYPVPLSLIFFCFYFFFALTRLKKSMFFSF